MKGKTCRSSAEVAAPSAAEAVPAVPEYRTVFGKMRTRGRRRSPAARCCQRPAVRSQWPNAGRTLRMVPLSRTTSIRRRRTPSAAWDCQRPAVRSQRPNAGRVVRMTAVKRMTLRTPTRWIRLVADPAAACSPTLSAILARLGRAAARHSPDSVGHTVGTRRGPLAEMTRATPISTLALVMRRALM